MYCGLRGIAPWQWLPQPSWFRWFVRLSALLFVSKEDVPDAPELIEPLETFETPFGNETREIHFDAVYHQEFYVYVDSTYQKRSTSQSSLSIN